MIDTLTHNLLELYDKLSSWEHEIVREANISLPQMHTLEVIGLYGPSKMNEISRKLGVTTGTLTVMISTLVKKDLVKKETNQNDSRSNIITLTDKGRQLYKEHHHYHHDLIKQVSSNLSENEVKQLNIVLEKINQQF